MRAPSSRRADWLVPALLVGLALVPSLSGVARIAQVARGGPVTADNARFIAMPWPVLVHIVAALPFGILGAFQFSGGLRQRWPRWHKAAGRILVPLALATALSGLWMTLRYPWPAMDGLGVYLLRMVFGSAMLAAVLLGVSTIVRRDYAGHAAWMTRAYAIGIGAGTQVFTHLPWMVLVGELTPVPRAFMLGAGWVINLVVAEWAIRRHASRSRKNASTYPSASRTTNPQSPSSIRDSSLSNVAPRSLNSANSTSGSMV